MRADPLILIEGDGETPDPDLEDPLFPADIGPLNAETCPPEVYLLGSRMAVSFVSLLVAPGATLKTMLQLTSAVSLALGKNLTGDKVWKRCNVWFLSNEEPIEVLRRRVWAICLEYGIDPGELQGRLFINSTVGQAVPFQVTKFENGESVVSPDVEKVIRFAKKIKVEAMFVDPFLTTTGGVNENDNALIGIAARQFNYIAATAPLALELAHHVSKDAADSESHVGNIARARGAGSLGTTVRYSYTLAKPNSKTAEALSMTEDERRRLIRFDMGDKNNYVLGGGGPRWFRLISVSLPNGNAKQEASSVGVPRVDTEIQFRSSDKEQIDDANHGRVRRILIAAIPEPTGSITLPRLIELVQQEAADDPAWPIGTSENRVRALIEAAIPEACGMSCDVQHDGETVRLYRRKVDPKRSNSVVMVTKETLDS